MLKHIAPSVENLCLDFLSCHCVLRLEIIGSWQECWHRQTWGMTISWLYCSHDCRPLSLLNLCWNVIFQGCTCTLIFWWLWGEHSIASGSNWQGGNWVTQSFEPWACPYGSSKRVFGLLTFLVIQAHDWLSILLLASKGRAVTGDLCHGDVFALVWAWGGSLSALWCLGELFFLPSKGMVQSRSNLEW